MWTTALNMTNPHAREGFLVLKQSCFRVAEVTEIIY